MEYRMSLHHGLTDLRSNHFTDSYILPWFLTCYQASLRFRLWAKFTSKHIRLTTHPVYLTWGRLTFAVGFVFPRWGQY